MEIKSKLEIRDLHILDNALDQIREQQAQEFAKGNAANSKLLYSLSCKVNALSHGNDSAIQRKLQIELTHHSDANNDNLVKKLTNKKSQNLQWLGGQGGVCSALLIVGLAMGCAATGAPFPAAAINMGSTVSKLLTDGIGSLDNLAKSSDQAAQTELNANKERFQQEISDKLSTNQSSKQNEASSLRQVQDANASDAQIFNAIVAGMR